ncbi:acyltransferase family protein [Pedobacter sp. SYSU D00535]|uniref:acyltransferase family protein n=1 Tax=Pedobacter sp. SYSU D00535 TaxID=2810308 RepID=UPI00351BDA33
MNTTKRLVSLDTFRGLTVAAMILVNNPGNWGALYPPLRHANWHGCTPTDLIFPFFLFIVGVAITFSLGSRKREISNHKSLVGSIIKRTVILFALGLILALFPLVLTDPLEALKTVRIPGVLQRIALVFFATAIIFLKMGWKAQAGIFAGLLGLYWILLTQVPVPGIGPANFDPDTNLGAWLDRVVFGESHLWQQSKTWDPEGLLGTLPAIATCLSGVLTGQLVKSKRIANGSKLMSMFGAGIVFLSAAIWWDDSFPINKALWTSSYVLYTSGFAMLLFAILYGVIDLKGYETWTKPFVFYGVNAITVFFLSSIMAKSMNAIKITAAGEEVSLKTWIYTSVYTPYLSPLNASLAWAFTFVFIWMLILWWMYSKKIIIKV